MRRRNAGADGKCAENARKAEEKKSRDLTFELSKPFDHHADWPASQPSSISNPEALNVPRHSQRIGFPFHDD